MTTSTPPERPPRSCIDVLAIPVQLRRRDQWVTFRYGLRDGKWTKIPKQASGKNAGKNAKTDDPETWSSFEDALAAFEADRTLDGISYIFSEDDPYCCVDIDKVKRSPERLAWALGIVARFGTYAEWSVSGNGLHLIGEGRMPDADGTPQKGRSNQKQQIEAYSRRRQLTFTGRVVEDSSTAVVDVQGALDWLLATEFKPKDTGTPAVRIDRPAGPIASADRIERIKERMFAGPRGAQLRRLYDGDAGDYVKSDGSLDWSGADLSLCSGAWYYADGDEAIVEAIWLDSGLATARPNGEKLNRADYRRSTLAQARGSKTFRDTHGYSAWEDPPRIQFKPTPAKARPIGNDGAATCPSDEPATLEDALKLIAQLHQENASLSESNRDLLGWVDRTAGFVEELQTINAGMRAQLTDQAERLAVLEPLVNQIDEIIARPETTIGPDGSKIKNGPTSDDKLTAITVARWMPYYRDKRKATGEPETIALGYLSKVMGGMPKKRLSTSLARQSSNDPNAGAPWHAKVTRAPKFDDGAPVINPKTGKQAWESSLEVIPWGDTKTMLRASATYALPELPKHGGSSEATAHRWGRCEKHPGGTVDLEGRCSVGRELLGKIRITSEQFEALKVQLGHSEATPPAVDDPGNPIERQNGHSDRPDGPAEHVNLQLVDSELARAEAMVAIPDPARIEEARIKREQRAPRIQFTEKAQVPREAPPRCVTVGCHEPAANGFACAGHLRGQLAPAVAEVET